MFAKVIVGIDGQRHDLDAIAASRAVAPNAELHLLHVYPDVEDPISPGDRKRERLRTGALEILADVQAEAGVPQALLDAVPDFSASRGIKRQARETGADLIVLGSAGNGTVGRILLGDTARGVLHGAPCPVLDVAHGPMVAQRPATIGVAFDRSDEATQALELAVDLARDGRARLEIVEAIDAAVVPPMWGFQVAELTASLIEPENARIAGLAAGLEVPATGKAVAGFTHAVLADLAERVDLMVCGSRSWGAPGRIALGSTADRLIHEAPCPVLVVPRGVRADAAPHRSPLTSPAD